jgi:hypothetical protein
MMRTLSRRASRARRPRHSRGQALVEFALVFPLFLVVLFSIIEFAFVFSAMLGISYASRDGALLAAEAGNGLGADCIVLKKIEDDVGPPASKAKISSVVIYQANPDGTEMTGVSNTWLRSGTSPCPDGTTVPYVRSTNGYPEASRCNVLLGCPDTATRPLDTIGVRITYVHQWVTPLGGLGGNGFGGQGGSGFTLTQSNSMRMEPIL